MTTTTYRFSIGEIRLMVIADGGDVMGEKHLGTMLNPLSEDVLQAFREGVQPYLFSLSAVYLETGTERILVDAGEGEGSKPRSGHLMDRLREEGIALESITKIMITHCHRDHIGGLLTAEGTPMFPQAEVYICREEWAWWVESGSVPAERTALVKAALSPYGERLHYVSDGDVLAEGVTVLALPGHTPGHCGLMIESNGERLIDIVDAIHLVVQMKFPHVSPKFDTDPTLSAQTRRAILERIAAEGVLTLAYHLPFPSLGHVRQEEEGFAWMPV